MCAKSKKNEWQHESGRQKDCARLKIALKTFLNPQPSPTLNLLNKARIAWRLRLQIGQCSRIGRWCRTRLVRTTTVDGLPTWRALTLRSRRHYSNSSPYLNLNQRHGRNSYHVGDPLQHNPTSIRVSQQMECTKSESFRSLRMIYSHIGLSPFKNINNK